MTDFWARVRRADGCWEWTGTRTPRGYGLTGHARGQERRAHREAYRLTNGPLPAGAVVMHTCDNPPCVNPAHLRLGTQADNLADARAKGRAVVPQLKGSQVATAKLTESQVREIRSRWQAGERRGVLAAEYGITPQNVWIVATGRGWTHIEGGFNS